MAATTALILVVVVGGAMPAAATHRGRQSTTSGSSEGTAIRAVAGKFGGEHVGGRSCGWQPGWPSGSGATTTVGVPDFLSGRFFSPFGGVSAAVSAALASIFGDDETAQIRVVTDQEAFEAAQQAEDGDSPEFIDPILGEEGIQIQIVEGVDSPFAQILLFIGGPHDLGTLIADPNAGTEELLLSEEQKSGEHYKESDFYPQIQRGQDADGSDLWWDPWYVSIDASTQFDQCAPGLIYSPRVNNPQILLPDVISVVTNELPPVQPALIPLDKDHGWAYVQVPTNFGVASSSLQDKYAHAEVEWIDPRGGPSQSVWAQVHAVATHLVFNPGDGTDPIVCAVTEMAYDPAVPGNCSHVYLDSSSITSGDQFQATVSVLWAGIYTDSNNANEIIDLAPTTATFNVAVAEARPSS